MLFEVLLLLAALATAVEIKHKPDSAYMFSCDTPVSYLANGTKATSWAQYLDETGTDPDSNGQGAVDHFAGPAGRASLKWPRDSENKAVIPYCYLEGKDRDRLHEVIQAVIHNWMTYLGPTGKEAGHAIRFEEHLDNKRQPMYCYEHSETDSEAWNSALPHETLAIMVEKDAGGWQASIGLHPDQSMPWANRLMGPGKGDLYEFAAMHELGHVMGMTHEHQRADRDKYIVVVPEKIDDFEECYQRAHQKDPRITRNTVCSHLRHALRYECKCRDFIKGMTGIHLPLFSFDSYDIDSIMHYPSAIGGTRKCQLYSGEEDTSECAIQVYKNFDDHSKGLTKLTPNLRPSEQDVRWVRHVYSWDG